MALPMNTAPVYHLTLPSTDAQLKFHPFLVKQEKALLLAMESEDENVMVDTLKDIIKDCIIDNIDISDLATFDIEYIFAQLRAKSVGEKIDIIVKCDDCEDEKAKVKLAIDIDHIAVEKDPTHTKKIELWDSVGVVMKYPSMNILKKMTNDAAKMTPDQMFDLITECMTMIYDSEQTYLIKETPREEVNQFLDGLTSEQFARIQHFFDTMPKLTHNIEYDCPVCEKHHVKKLEGLKSFFS